MAYFTGTKALQQGFPGRIKKLDVFLLGFPGGTTGAAEDPGGPDAYIEKSFKIMVFIIKCPLHDCPVW